MNQLRAINYIPKQHQQILHFELYLWHQSTNKDSRLLICNGGINIKCNTFAIILTSFVLISVLLLFRSTSFSYYVRYTNFLIPIVNPSHVQQWYFRTPTHPIKIHKCLSNPNDLLAILRVLSVRFSSARLHTLQNNLRFHLTYIITYNIHRCYLIKSSSSYLGTFIINTIFHTGLMLS